MMTTKNSYAASLTMPSEREIVMTRVFDAPRKLVFQVYTDPQQIPNWWGRRSHTTRVDKMDVRVGGLWRYIESDEAGSEACFNGEYREIVPPEKIVSTFEFEGMPGHIGLVTTVFEELPDGRTRLTETSLFPSSEDRDGIIASGMEEGANETWDRLAEVLARAAR
jgi:uncharacterized protein YndB with AHSA1/START domain